MEQTKKDAFLFTLNGNAVLAGEDLKPVYNAAFIKVAHQESGRFKAVEVSPFPAYVTVARNMREKGVMIFFVYFDGAYLNTCQFSKIELLP